MFSPPESTPNKFFLLNFSLLSRSMMMLVFDAIDAIGLCCIFFSLFISSNGVWSVFYLLTVRYNGSIMQIKLGFKCRCGEFASIFFQHLRNPNRIEEMLTPRQSFCMQNRPFSRYCTRFVCFLSNLLLYMLEIYFHVLILPVRCSLLNT